MFIIYGTKSFEKTLAAAGPDLCPVCQQNTQYTILRVIRWFTLFYIPIIPFSFKYYRVCGYCRNSVSMDSAVAKEIVKRVNAQPAETSAV